jgi:hypothetical protein
MSESHEIVLPTYERELGEAASAGNQAWINDVQKRYHTERERLANLSNDKESNGDDARSRSTTGTVKSSGRSQS